MSSLKNDNQILIIGVLMLGAYMVMRPRPVQRIQARSSAPTSMPASVGSGLAQAGVGAISNWLQNMISGTNNASQADRRMIDPDLMAGPDFGLQDVAVPTGEPNFLGDVLGDEIWLA